MDAVIVVFPGSNCDRDVRVALGQSMGSMPKMVWHRETELPKTDLIVLPGGFAFGDYLRCGAIAAQSPVMRDVVARARAGTPVLAICNGFQIAIEAGLLPGAMIANANLKFVCQEIYLRVENTDTIFTRGYQPDNVIRLPVAHHDGNFVADAETLRMLQQEDRIVFRYCATDGKRTPAANPNGSVDNIAGILDRSGRVLGMMPHPERLAEAALGGTDGRTLFNSLVETLQ